MFLVHWSSRSKYGNASRQVLHSISRRVLRFKIYRDIPERSFGHAGLVSLLVPPEKRCRPSAVPKRSRNLFASL